jgi:hypothetical protein
MGIYLRTEHTIGNDVDSGWHLAEGPGLTEVTEAIVQACSKGEAIALQLKKGGVIVLNGGATAVVEISEHERSQFP